MWEWITANWQGIVATLALIVAVHEVRSTRAHNRLSVLPQIDTFIKTDEIDQTIEVSLHNGGLGPARIKEFTVYCNGRRLSEDSIGDALSFASGEILKGNVCTINVGGPDPGYVLTAGANGLLLHWKFSGSHKLTVSEMRSLLHKIDFTVKYESFYKKQMPLLDTRKDRGKL
jgi:hypothetical protein